VVPILRFAACVGLLLLMGGCSWIGALTDWLTSHSQHAELNFPLHAVEEVDEAEYIVSPDKLAKTPDGSGSFYTHARAMLEAGRPALAVKYFRRSLGQEAVTTETLNGLAIAYWELSREDLALTYFQKALSEKPTDVATLNNIGYAALSKNEYAFAREVLTRAYIIEPNPVVTANLKLLDQETTVVAAAREIPKKFFFRQPAAHSVVTKAERVNRYVTRVDNKLFREIFSSESLPTRDEEQCVTRRRWMNYNPSVYDDCIVSKVVPSNVQTRDVNSSARVDFKVF